MKQVLSIVAQVLLIVAIAWVIQHRTKESTPPPVPVVGSKGDLGDLGSEGAKGQQGATGILDTKSKFGLRWNCLEPSVFVDGQTTGGTNIEFLVVHQTEYTPPPQTLLLRHFTGMVACEFQWFDGEMMQARYKSLKQCDVPTTFDALWGGAVFTSEVELQYTDSRFPADPYDIILCRDQIVTHSWY
jgi:hypothetical protein